jgi:hypothetical protein
MKILITLSVIAIIVLFYGVVLSMLAKLLGMILTIPNIIIVAFKYKKTNGYLKAFNNYNFQDALETDIFLHYNLRTFWNTTLSKGGVKFGFKTENHDEELITLSARIGEKYLEKSLSITGLVLYYFLYVIDFGKWKNGGHCINAYNSTLK